MRKLIKHIIFVLLLFATGLSAEANNRIWRALTTDDGLGDLLVNVLYKDRDGYVWIGTGNSLDRFDGVHVRSFKITGPNEKLKRVNALAEMPGGELWMGNGMGLWRVNRAAQTVEPMMTDIISDAVYALYADTVSSTLYVGTKRGLFICKGGRCEHVLPDANLFADSNAVHGITSDEAGNLWLATGNGLCFMQAGTRHFEVFHNEIGGKHRCAFHCITRLGSRLFLGTMEQGIVAFHLDTKQFAPYVDVECNVISTLSGNGNDLLYVGTDGAGVRVIDVTRDSIVRTLRHETGSEEGIRSNSVYSLLVDRDGIMWVGFYQQGLDYVLYQNHLFDVYNYRSRFDTADLPVRALAVSGSEKLIGTRDGLFYIDEARGRFARFHTPEMRSAMIFCIEPYESGYAIGTYGGGLYLFDPERLTLKDFPADERIPFQTGHIFALRTDSEGTLWIGTSQGLYCYKDGRRVAHYTSSNSQLPEGNVYEIFFDSTRKGWICTENGMCLWEPSTQKLRTDLFPEGFLHHEKIRVVYEDSAHQLYFFPDKGALFFSDLSMNSFHCLQPGTPLEGRDGMFVMEDADGWLWIGTGNGLFHYDKREHFVPYNFVDGIPSGIFTLCRPVRDAQGNFWFGNSKGLLHLDVSRLQREKRDFYPVQVSDCLLHGKRTVSFHFSDFSYTDPAYMSYEYRLEDVDEGWMSLTGKSEVTYYDLPSGDYAFHIRRMGQPESEAVKRLHISSGYNPAWIVAVCLLCGLGGFLVWRWRLEAAKSRARSALRSLKKGKEEEVLVAQEEKANEITPEEKYRTLNLSDEERARLLAALQEKMEIEKLYRQPDLKVADLAAAIGTTSHTLSYLFNQHLEVNYYDYVNDFRIEEFKRIVKHEDVSRYTLSALSEMCGFSSRASFFRYFKKATGITPNEYLKQQKH